MGWLAGLLSGYNDRNQQLWQEQMQQQMLANERESKVYEAMLNSPDPYVRTLGGVGMLNAAAPLRRKSGLAGFMGQMEQNPVWNQVAQYANTPQTYTHMVPDADQTANQIGQAVRDIGGGQPPLPSTARFSLPTSPQDATTTGGVPDTSVAPAQGTTAIPTPPAGTGGGSLAQSANQTTTPGSAMPTQVTPTPQTPPAPIASTPPPRPPGGGMLSMFGLGGPPPTQPHMHAETYQAYPEIIPSGLESMVAGEQAKVRGEIGGMAQMFKEAGYSDADAQQRALQLYAVQHGGMSRMMTALLPKSKQGLTTNPDGTQSYVFRNFNPGTGAYEDEYGNPDHTFRPQEFVSMGPDAELAAKFLGLPRASAASPDQITQIVNIGNEFNYARKNRMTSNEARARAANLLPYGTVGEQDQLAQYLISESTRVFGPPDANAPPAPPTTAPPAGGTTQPPATTPPPAGGSTTPPAAAAPPSAGPPPTPPPAAGGGVKPPSVRIDPSTMGQLNVPQQPGLRPAQQIPFAERSRLTNKPFSNEQADKRMQVKAQIDLIDRGLAAMTAAGYDKDNDVGHMLDLASKYRAGESDPIGNVIQQLDLAGLQSAASSLTGGTASRSYQFFGDRRQHAPRIPTSNQIALYKDFGVDPKVINERSRTWPFGSDKDGWDSPQLAVEKLRQIRQMAVDLLNEEPNAMRETPYPAGTEVQPAGAGPAAPGAGPAGGAQASPVVQMDPKTKVWSVTRPSP